MRDTRRMDPFDLGVLTIVALLTATLSGVLGMAGGITLLAVMLLYLEPLVAIPIHGAIQLISNSSRAVIQRRHVAWPITARFAVLLLPAGYLGYSFARGLPPDTLKAAIGVFVLLATWLPGVLLLGTLGAIDSWTVLDRTWAAPVFGAIGLTTDALRVAAEQATP